MTSAEGQASARMRGGIASRIRWDTLAVRSADHPSGGVPAATWAAFAVLGAATLTAIGMTAAGIDSIDPAQARSGLAPPSDIAARPAPAAVMPAPPTGAATMLALTRTPDPDNLVLVLPRAPLQIPRQEGLVFSLSQTPPEVELVFALPEPSPQRGQPAAVPARVSARNPIPPVDGPKAAWREARVLPDRPVVAAPRAKPAATLLVTPPVRKAEPVTPVLKPIVMARAGPVGALPRVVHKPRLSGLPAAPISAGAPPEGTQPPTIAAMTERFDSLGYDLAAVRATTSPVPRVYLDSLPGDLAQVSSTDAKKRLFVQAVLPIILRINEDIIAARWRVTRLEERLMWLGTVTPADREWLVATAEHYGTLPFDIAGLLSRMDVVPPSLALAQGAEESGWGTSRFAREGNAIFGQYTYKSVTGMVPKRRDADRRHRVRRYDTLLEATEAYVHNLNTHPAYEDFRDRRASLRRAGRPLGGYDLAGQLRSYSERREAYIESIRQLIRQNRLGDFDRAWLNNRQWTALVGLPSGRPI